MKCVRHRIEDCPDCKARTRMFTQSEKETLGRDKGPDADEIDRMFTSTATINPPMQSISYEELEKMMTEIDKLSKKWVLVSPTGQAFVSEDPLVLFRAFLMCVPLNDLLPKA